MPGNETIENADAEFIPRLTRHLAHELNNPIGAISSAIFLIKDFISTSKDGAVSTSEIQPFVESIQEEAEKLTRVVEEYSKYFSTRSILAMPLDLAEFVRHRAEDLKRDGLPVVFTGSSEPVVISGDSGALTYILRELVTSAQFSGARVIEIEVQSGDRPQIVLTDDRTEGSSQGEIMAQFEPLSTRQRGLGLKLPLVRKMVEFHGGTIEASKGENGRVTIRLIFPVQSNPVS